jgi:tetratricopeptide (TPR) repeat protein
MTRMCLAGRILVLLFALPTVAVADPMARAGWIGLKAPNFYVIGDVGQRDLREVTRRLEQFREAIGIIFPKAILSTSTPTTVLVFKSHKNYEPVKPLYQGKVEKQIAGYFQPGRTMNYVTFTMEGGIEQLDVVYHEYVHLIVNNNIADVPLWFNEGLAEYYRTFQITANGKLATLGKVDPDHVLLLRDHFIPLADLVKVDHKSPLYNESARSSIFYAESWALVHYLLLGEQQKYVSHAGNFVAALADGAPFEEACQRQLGLTGDQLQQQLTRYLRGDMFPMQSARFTDRIGRIDDLPVTPVSEAEVHASLGAVLLSMGRVADARAELDRAVALDAGYAPAHTSLGLAASRENKPEDARKELELAAGLPTATYVSQFEYANLLAQSWANPAPGDGEKMEKALRRSIELNPSYPDAYEMLAWKLGQQQAGLDEALGMVGKALDLAPGREAYVFRKATLLANKQDFAGARALLTQLIRGGNDETVRANAQRELAQVNDFERRKAEYEANRASGATGSGTASSTVETPGRQQVRPSLRPMKPGENRVFGKLTAIQCAATAVVVIVKTPEGVTLRAHAAKFNEIDLVTYRDDLRGGVQCGARAAAEPVLLTFIPDAGSSSGGTAVAVEFVPLDYKP